MAKSFLGVGCGFPVRPGASGALALARYEDSVRESIWIILSTAKGERAMRSDFGCEIYDLVFEVNSASTAGRVAHAVRDALLMLEPRIDVLDVQVQSQTGGEVLLISVDYALRATNNVFNVVYPFYLERGVTP